MKFIHAGDIHLDSALAGLSAHEDAPLERLRGATRSAFTALVNLALSENVDCVLFPGDIFDTGWRDFETGIFFMRQMARLNEAGIPVFLLRGNHDAEEEMIRTLTPPPNLHVFGSDRPETFRLDADGLQLAIHGQSFRKADTRDNLAAGYRPVEGCLNIALLHTALTGSYADHAPYAPCTLAELKNKGMDYWALGHVHEYTILSDAPYVAFSGNTQGRHIREPGARGALLVTVKHGVVQPPQRLYVDVLRWQPVYVDVGGTENVDEAMSRVRDAFEAVMDGADGRPVAARVRLTGKTAAHGALLGQRRAVRANVQTQAEFVDSKDLWIEKIEVETAPPRDADEIEARADALADLQSLLREAPADLDFVLTLKNDFGPMLDKLPRGAFADKDAVLLQQLAAGDYTPLIKAVVPDLLDRVEQEG